MYPAIDIEASVSRAMNRIVDTRHEAAARRFRAVYSTYRKHRDLINVGAYRAGSDPEVDQAVALWPQLKQFLCQAMDEPENLDHSISQLYALVDPDMDEPQPEETFNHDPR